eukprot:scaffold90946_cov61-Phaeocystis_antarctica.AAC.3
MLLPGESVFPPLSNLARPCNSLGRLLRSVVAAAGGAVASLAPGAPRMCDPCTADALLEAFAVRRSCRAAPPSQTWRGRVTAVATAQPLLRLGPCDSWR